MRTPRDVRLGRLRRLDRDRFDVIVVGAGMGGLTAAALLARRGRRVLVVDQHSIPGGSATTFRRTGYEFDIGLHYVGGCHPNGMIPRILRAGGVTGVQFEELDPDGYDTLVFPDFRFRFPKGVERFRQRLHRTFPGERKGIDRYVEMMRQIQRLQWVPAEPLSALWTLPRSLMLLRWAGARFDEFLDTCTRNTRLRAVLAGQHGDYGQPPSRAATVVCSGLTAHYLQGAYYPRGGGQVISDRLADAIERCGGTILLRSRVERILIARGAASGVELWSKHLGHRTVRAPVVISDADLKHTLCELVGAEHLSAETIQRTERFAMSPAAAIVCLGIARDLEAEGYPRTNYWIQPGYDYEPGYAALARGELPSDPFLLVTTASLKDPDNPRLAPPGITNLQLMVFAPSTPRFWGVTREEARTGAYRTSEAYRRKKVELADVAIDTASRVLPGLREQIVFQEVATPLTHARYTGATGGTSYGIALTPQQVLFKRPGARTEIEGLYLCGASCRSGHGIAGVALSGMHAAAQVLGSQLVREVLGPANRVHSGPGAGP